MLTSNSFQDFSLHQFQQEMPLLFIGNLANGDLRNK
jgi:hypothetical protein